MIKREEIQSITNNYSHISIGVLGSHSAEEVGIAAKTFGFKTIVICQQGREELYAKHSKHLFDKVIILDRFSDITETIDELVKLNTIFFPNRSFSVYVGYDRIENEFVVPIYGNRFLLRAEERDVKRSQYWLLEKAGIRIPKMFQTPNDIDRLALIKIQQAENPLERAFFYVESPEDYHTQVEKLMDSGIIDDAGLKEARIEEFIIGPRFNANFQSFALGGFDFVGFDDRIQTNLQGILNLPTKEQLKIDIPLMNEEIGHYGITMRESKKPMIYHAADKFIKICKKYYPPGIIGLFALQGVIPQPLDFVVFDASLRIPGSPCIGPTSPEMRRLALKYGIEIHSALDLCMMEIKQAMKEKRIGEIVT